MDDTATATPLRAKTETLERPTIGTIDETTELPASLLPWNVICWDDPVNTMDFVVGVFQELFAFPYEEAVKRMLEVHLQGRSIVSSGPKEQSEYYAERLGMFGLTASIEQA